VENAEVLHSISTLLEIAPEDSFVIGGESVYRALLPYCDTAYITKIDAAFPADRYFPNLDQDPAWTPTEESEPLEQDGLKFRYLVYHKN
jgi:dihydrofolate reductase